MIKQIKYNGLFTEDLGIFVCEEPQYGMPKPKMITDSVPFSDAVYDFSKMDGSLHYESRTLEYTFCLQGADASEAHDMLSKTLAWLYSDGDNKLYDEHFGGWHFTDVRCIGVQPPVYASQSKKVIKLTATFQAGVYMESNTGERIPLAILTPTSDSAKYVFAKIGGTNSSLSYAKPDSASVGFDTFTLSSDGLTATATVSATDWGKTLVSLNGTFTGITAIGSGGLVAPQQYDGKVFYGAVAASVTMITLKITFGSPTTSAIGNVMRLGYSAMVDCPQSPSTNSLKLTAEDSEPTVTINGAATPADDIAIPGGITVMTISGCKDDKLTLAYDSIKRRL